MKRFCFTFLLIILNGCLGAQQTIQVAAASSLAPVMTLIQADFAVAQPEYRIQVVLGSSGALVTQILNGAAQDIFLGADREFPEKLIGAGIAIAPVKTFARGSLILVSTSPRDLSSGLKILIRQEITKVAMANPDLAPFGRAAKQALQAQGLWDQVKAKAVMGSSAQQAYAFTVQGTGIGLLSRSSDLTGKTWIPVDQKLYQPLDHGYVVMKKSKTTSGVQKFIAYLASPRATQILKKAGYLVPGDF